MKDSFIFIKKEGTKIKDFLSLYESKGVKIESVGQVWSMTQLDLDSVSYFIFRENLVSIYGDEIKKYCNRYYSAYFIGEEI